MVDHGRLTPSLNQQPSKSPALLYIAHPALTNIELTFLPIGWRQISRVTSVDGERIEGEFELSRNHWGLRTALSSRPGFPGT